MSRAENRDRNVWKGIASGVVAGLVASNVMNQFQSGLKALLNDSKETKSSSENEEPATVKAAEVISNGVVDHQLTKREKKVAGPAMHYAMGATSGAIYGIAAELQPTVTVGAGATFGAAVWLMADEMAVPSLGFQVHRGSRLYQRTFRRWRLISFTVSPRMRCGVLFAVRFEYKGQG